MKTHLIPLAVSLYWLSFVGLGFGAWLWMDVRKAPEWPQMFRRFIFKAPVVAQLFLFFVVGWALMVPIILVGYLLGLSIWFVNAFYLMLLLGVLASVWLRRVSFLEYGSTLVARLRKPSFAAVIFMGMALATVSVAARLGGFLANGTDSYVHMARINQIAYEGLTIADPFLSGVVESRYHVNAVYALYASAVTLGGVPVYEVWRLSYIVFALAMLASLYVTAWYFLPRAWKEGWPYLIAVLGFVTTASMWRTTNYPNEIVLLWMTAFVIGVVRWLRHKDPVLMVLGAVLIATTHATYGLITFCFTAFLVGITLLFELWQNRSWQWRLYVPVLIMGIVALLPALFSLTFPNRMSDAVFNFQEANTSFHQVSAGPFSILSPPIFQNPGVMGLLLMGFGLLGLVWLFWRAESYAKRIVILALALFYPVAIAYNPVVHLVLSEQLPQWMIQRFSSMDRLQLITGATGLVVVIVWLIRRVVSVRWQLLVAAPLAVMIVLPLGLQRVRALNAQNGTYIQLSKSLHGFEPSLAGRTIYASPGVSFLLPSAVKDVDVVWLPETNATPMANMALHQACGEALERNLSLGDLQSAGITRVVVGGWEPELRELARLKPYLRVVDGNDQFIVFAVEDMTRAPEAGSKCSIPRGM